MKHVIRCITIMALCLPLTPSLPDEEYEFLNEQVLQYALERRGQTIGRGECWDLAAAPLRALHATWDGRMGFGKKVGSGNAGGLSIEPGIQVLPGDIVQFRSVRTSWEKRLPNGGRQWGSENIGAPDHTAIVKTFDGTSLFSLLHQNVNGRRYIVETDLDIANVKSGTYIIFRPYKLKGSGGEYAD